MALTLPCTELEQPYDDIEAQRLEAVDKWESNDRKRTGFKNKLRLRIDTSEEDVKALAMYAGLSKKTRSGSARRRKSFGRRKRNKTRRNGGLGRRRSIQWMTGFCRVIRRRVCNDLNHGASVEFGHVFLGWKFSV
jgi:hypothetical protein